MNNNKLVNHHNQNQSFPPEVDSVRASPSPEPEVVVLPGLVPRLGGGIDLRSVTAAVVTNLLGNCPAHPLGNLLEWSPVNS